MAAESHFGPELAFRVTLDRPGLHEIWAQFGRDGDIITAPFVVDVAP